MSKNPKEGVPRWLPINNCHTGRVEISLPFPRRIDQETILIDVKRLTLLMNLAGIDKLTVFPQDFAAQHQAKTRSVGPNGTERITTALSETTPVASSMPSDTGRSSQRSANWRDVFLGVDMNQLAEYAREHGSDYADATPYAAALSNILCRCVATEGTDFLLNWLKFSPSEKLATSLTGFTNLALLSNLAEGSTTMLEFIYSEILYLISMRVILFCERRITKNASKSLGYRATLFPNFELDRVVLLQLLSRTKDVVTVASIPADHYL